MSELLAYREFGQGTPLVILHGLFGSGRNWQTIARHLADRYRVLTVDLRNHGDSHWTPTMSIVEMANDLSRLFDALQLDDAFVLGHSLGGKTVMWFALNHPAQVEQLIVVDIAPVRYSHTFLPYVDAMQSLDLRQFQRRAEAEAALAAAIADEPTRKFLAQNLINTPNGLAWKVNLAAVKASMAQILDFPEIGDREYDRRALFVSGETSDYIETAHINVIAEHFPNAEFAVIAGAGHRVHADQRGPFLDRVITFLDSAYA